MEYRYPVLANVLRSIAADWSEENITYQLQRLTSDEMRKLRELFFTAEMIEDNRGDNPFEDAA
tara:strand:- start:830 stop:1018 length:189 start_codon:yes stop_codon:yes gene_type:complete